MFGHTNKNKYSESREIINPFIRKSVANSLLTHKYINY